MEDSSTLEERARRRRDWPISRHRLEDSEACRVPSDMTGEERWAAMWDLTLAA